MEVKTVSHGGSSIELQVAEGEEYLVLGHEQENLAEYVIIGPEDQVSMTRFEHDAKRGKSTEIMKSANGLRVAGVSRRRGLLRRFVEVTAVDVHQGDKVVVENSTGVQYTTGAITVIHHL